jgi:hypothetical protein
MKTLQEIKNHYAQEQGYEDWEDLIEDNWKTILMESHMNEICIRAQKLALEKASENATMLFDAVYDWHAVNKESIINENNLIR